MNKNLVVENTTVSETEIQLYHYTENRAIEVLSNLACMPDIVNARVLVSWSKEDIFGTPIQSELIDEDHSEDLKCLREGGASDWLVNAARSLFNGQDFEEAADSHEYILGGCTYRFWFESVIIEHTTGLDDKEFIARVTSKNTPEQAILNQFIELVKPDLQIILRDAGLGDDCNRALNRISVRATAIQLQLADKRGRHE